MDKGITDQYHQPVRDEETGMVYLLTIQDKRGPDFNTTKVIGANGFHDWVSSQNEKVGLIPPGQRLCDCNTSGDLG